MKKVIITSLLLATVLLAGVLEVHVVRPAAGLGQLLWDDDEAFLFIEETVDGLRMPYLQYGAAAVPAYLLGFQPSSRDQKSTRTIIRITAQSEEVHVLRMPHGPFSLRPLGHRVYARVNGVPMRWSGSRFEPADVNEWAETVRLPSSDFSNVNGWSNRSDVLHRGIGETRYWLRLGGEAVDVINVNNFFEKFNAIDIQRNGAARKRLWSIDSNIKWVGQEQYLAAFR